MTRSGPLALLASHRAFRRYWLARQVSLAGSGVTALVMPVLVYRLTASSAWTGLTVVAESVPVLLVGPVAGVVADRRPARGITVSCDLLAAIALGSIPLAAAFDVLTVGQAVAVAFVGGCAAAFFLAASFGVVVGLVGRDSTGTAQASLSVAGAVADLGVPVVAGALLAFVSAPALLSLDAISFLVSAVLLRSVPHHAMDQVRSTGSSTAGRVRDALAGFRFVFSTAGLSWLVAVAAAQTFSGGMFIGQLVPWAVRHLHLPPGDARVGLLLSAWGIGAMLAGAVFGRLGARVQEVRVVTVLLVPAGLLPVAVAFARPWWLAAIALIVWSTVTMTVAISAAVARMKITPDELQGRVGMAARMLSFGVGWPLGALAGAVLAPRLGPAGAIALGSTAMLACVPARSRQHRGATSAQAGAP